MPTTTPSHPSTLPGEEEDMFQLWYATHARERGLNPNPDDPRHFYDYRGAFLGGAEPDVFGHWPSEYKREGHPRLFLPNEKTGVVEDTRTGRPAGNLRVDGPTSGNLRVGTESEDGPGNLRSMHPSGVGKKGKR